MIFENEQMCEEMLQASACLPHLFNASLMRERKALGYLGRMAGGAMGRLNLASKQRANWHFVSDLEEIGRPVAEAWLKAHRADIGARSTWELPN